MDRCLGDKSEGGVALHATAPTEERNLTLVKKIWPLTKVRGKKAACMGLRVSFLTPGATPKCLMSEECQGCFSCTLGKALSRAKRAVQYPSTVRAGGISVGSNDSAAVVTTLEGVRMAGWTMNG